MTQVIAPFYLFLGLSFAGDCKGRIVDEFDADIIPFHPGKFASHYYIAAMFKYIDGRIKVAFANCTEFPEHISER